PPDPETPPLHGFSENGLGEGAGEGLIVEDTDDEGRIRVGERLGRPSGEFCEVVEEGGLDLEFERRRSVLSGSGGRQGQEAQDRAGASPRCGRRRVTRTRAAPVSHEHARPPGRRACLEMTDRCRRITRAKYKVARSRRKPRRPGAPRPWATAARLTRPRRRT